MSKNEPTTKMDNSFESIFLKNILKITVLFVVCSPILIYLIVYVIGHWLPKDFYGAVQVSNSQSWIGFAGSILGGSMTMFAVVFNIQHERNRREDEKRLQYLPIIKCVHVESSEVSTVIKNLRNYKVKNISDHPLTDLRVKNLEFQWLSVENEEFEKAEILLKVNPGVEKYLANFQLIAPNDSANIPLSFGFDDNEESIKLKKSANYIKQVMDFEYYDIFKNGPYKHRFEIIVSKRYLEPASVQEFIIQRIWNRPDIGEKIVK